MSILSIDTQFDSASIVRAAARRLYESPYYFLKGISCHVDGGVLTLRGRVPMQPLREFAELIVSRVDGVHKVINLIEVRDPQRRSA
jgi:osmotically-inducible protein OsmY